MTEGKVSLSLEKIKNGYVLRRSWCDKSKNDTPGNYHSEEIFLKELPETFAKYMVKGEVGQEPAKDMDEANDQADYILSKKDKEKDKDNGSES